MAAPRKLLNPEKPPFHNKQWNICYQEFIANLPSPISRRNYSYTLRRLFAANPKKTPDQYTRQDIEAFVNSPTMGRVNPGQPISNPSRNNRVLRLKSFYAWCSQYSIQYRGQLRPILRGMKPTDGIKLKKIGEADRALDEDEIARFFAVIPQTRIGLRDKAYFLMLFWTGRRQSEIRLLRWKDLEQVVFEGGSGGWIYSWQGKGHLSRDDAASLPVPALAALKKYLAAVGRITLDAAGEITASSMRPEDPLFVGWPNEEWDTQPISPAAVNRRFRAYANAAGLPLSRCIHSFRYAAAGERYSANGHDPLEVQRFLRHKNLQTTLRYLEPTQRKKRADPIVARLYTKWEML
jgi:integrase